jgi:hypothetical protein
VAEKLIISIGLYNSYTRCESVVESLLRVRKLEEARCVFTNTGIPDFNMFKKVAQLPRFHYEQKSNPKAQCYKDVVKDKIISSMPFIDYHTIYWNTDDDYVFNPYVIEWIQTIFRENPDVAFLSPLRGPFPEPGHYAVRSGFRFTKWKSTMGGSICARASVFIQNALEYIERPDSDPMFDQGFWDYIEVKYDLPNLVFTPLDFSLVQHVNFGSRYSRVGHMSAVNFIKEENPWNYARVWQ